MNLTEAEEIIEKHEEFEDKDCTCFQSVPCSKCENSPSEDMYEEAKDLIKKGEERAIISLDELLEHELGEYSFEWKINKDDIEFYEGEYIIDVDYYMYDREKSDILTFKVGEEGVFICKYDDVYEEIKIYEPSIKHLWMLIKWD